MTKVHDVPVEIWLLIADYIRTNEMSFGIYYDATLDMWKPRWSFPTALWNDGVYSLSTTCLYLRQTLFHLLEECLSIRYPGRSPQLGSFQAFTESLVQQTAEHIRQRVKDVRIVSTANSQNPQVYRTPSGVCHILEHHQNVHRLHLDHVCLNNTLLHTLLSIPLTTLHLTSCYLFDVISDAFDSDTVNRLLSASRLLSLQVHNPRGPKSKLAPWLHAMFRGTLQKLDIDIGVLFPSKWPALPQLRSLAVSTSSSNLPADFSVAVAAALSNSPKLEELILDRALSAPIPPSIVPNLRSVVCSHADASAIIPGRPVTHAEVLSSVWDGSPSWDDISCGLQGSTTPIQVCRLRRIVDVGKPMGTFVADHLPKLISALPEVLELVLPTFANTSEKDFLASIPLLKRLRNLHSVTFGAPIQSFTAYKKLTDVIQAQLSAGSESDRDVEVFFDTDFLAPYRRKGEPALGVAAVMREPAFEEGLLAPGISLNVPTL